MPVIGTISSAAASKLDFIRQDNLEPEVPPLDFPEESQAESLNSLLASSAGAFWM